MKIVIISDLHGNFDALEALPETYNELWVLGDLVNYGPEPAAGVDFVKANCSMLCRETTTIPSDMTKIPIVALASERWPM